LEVKAIFEQLPQKRLDLFPGKLGVTLDFGVDAGLDESISHNLISIGLWNAKL
jgi:hypothetical protein